MNSLILGGFWGGWALLSPNLRSQLFWLQITCVKLLNSVIFEFGMSFPSTWLSALMQLSKQ